MYSNAPAVQSYNPAAAAAAADGSAPQMHPAANQPYYGVPGQQMSLPPGAPATMPGYAAAGQPQYHMGGQGGGGGYPAHTGVPGAQTAVPGAPTGYQAPTMQAPVTQMYMPSASGAVQQPPPPAAAEYQPYSMHGQ